MNQKIRILNKRGPLAKKQRNVSSSRSVALAPPPFIAQALREITIRCVASGAFGNGITMQQLALLGPGVMALTATTSQQISPLTRLRRIRMWAPVTTAGTPVTCSLTWVNMSEDFQTPPRTFSDTSVSFDRPAHLSCRPPTGGLSSKWHDSSLTDNLVLIDCPQGTTIDFEIDWLLMDNAQAHGAIAGPVLVGATPGQIYHHPISVLVPSIVNQL